MWADVRRFPCFCCGMTGLGVCLDRKGRPFLKCVMCGSILFPRGGEVAVCHAINMARLCEENPALGAAVRQQAFAAASTGSAVRELLRPISRTADLAPVASPLPESAPPERVAV